jgi:Ni,Fe-hydrogenase I cytochrome b subunit
MTHSICHALLRVLFLLFAGVILVICVAQAFYLVIVDKEYRKDLFERELGKPER